MYRVYGQFIIDDIAQSIVVGNQIRYISCIDEGHDAATWAMSREQKYRMTEYDIKMNTFLPCRRVKPRDNTSNIQAVVFVG
ncbi:hypothetical protein RIMD111065_19420 [Aeromonas hydrophila]|nr:hypothetical protein RIMD111065_19420 [Aeromonas hydrophila]